MRNKKLTEDMIDSLKNDYGVLSTQELVNKYNCSYSTIERFCKSHGFKSKRDPTCQQKNKYEYLHAHLDEFLSDWEDHILTEEELIEKYQAPMTALYSQATLFGVYRKTLEKRIDTSSLIVDYRDNIISQQDICKKYGISNGTKTKILKNNNIDLDPVGIRSRKYYFNEYFLDTIDSEEKAYFLGFVYADGGHNTDRKTLNITIQERDQDLLTKFYEMFECQRELRRVYNKQYDRYYVNFCLQSTYLSNQLLNLGVPADKSYKITFPNFISDSLLKHFIRGYFDGDGCIGLSQRGWRSTQVRFTGNEHFLHDIQLVIKSKTNVDMILYHEKKSKICDLQKSGIFNVYQILQYLYKDAAIYLQRKYDRYINFANKYEKEVLN